MVFLGSQLLIKAAHIRTELGTMCKESTRWLQMYLNRPETCVCDQNKSDLLRWMIGSSTFEQFLSKAFPNEERKNTCEMLIPAVKALLSRANTLGVTSFVLGIKSPESFLNLLGSGLYVPVLPIIAARLKLNENLNQPIDNIVLLVRNQLDTIAHAMMCGKTLAEQKNQLDFLNRHVWMVIVNSDSPLDNCSGSLETSRVSGDKDLTVGGTVHLMVTGQNNGTSWLRRPLAVMDPIIHVDASDPEAVFHVMNTAALFRHLFQEDIYINLETLHPPDCMKNEISGVLEKLEIRKPVLNYFSQKLIDENLTTATDVENTVSGYQQWFREQYYLAEKEVTGISHWFRDKLLHASNFLSKKEVKEEYSYQVTESELDTLIGCIQASWVSHEYHKKVGKIFTKRFELAKQGKITWTMAEMLAIAYLLKQNVSVRISGSDLNSNQYSERHYWLLNTKTGESILPFAEMFKNDAQFSMCESKSLSADARLGYELGASQSSFKSITVWESSSSEFSTLQYTLDRFISKNGQWYRRSNLIILLPHDPDLSEFSQPSRILDLCRLEDSPNWTVANVSSPANYFHLLIKQADSDTPLVIFSHKTLLKDVISPKEEFVRTKFQCYISEEKETCSDIVRVLVCTGRLCHELMDVRQARSMSSLVAISKLEQLYPFPSTELVADISRFRHASVHWVQEEVGSRGWWDWVAPNMKEALRNIKFDLHLIQPRGGPTKGRMSCSRKDVINSALSIY